MKHVSTSGATISVLVSCTGSTSCKIKLTAAVREPIRRGKVIALAASTKTIKKTITIASKTATIPAGSTKTIRLHPERCWQTTARQTPIRSRRSSPSHNHARP